MNIGRGLRGRARSRKRRTPWGRDGFYFPVKGGETMPKVTMSFTFSLPDKVFTKLKSISIETKKPIGEVIGEVCEGNRGEFSDLIISNLKEFISGYRNYVRSKNIKSRRR
jgi:hypothetical protein